MTQRILYGAPGSGHSYKVALALTFLGLDHEYRAVDLAVPRAQRPADFRQASRFGEVPVLVEGAALVQSNAILLHLARTTGRLIGDEGWERLEQWLFWEANRIGLSVPNLRFALRFEPDTPLDVLAWLEARARRDLDGLDAALDMGKPFLTGAQASIADLSCCAYLYWANEAGLDMAGWPAVEAWLGRISEIPGWHLPEAMLG